MHGDVSFVSDKVIRGYSQLRRDAEAGKPYKTSKPREKEEKRVEKEVQTGLFGGESDV